MKASDIGFIQGVLEAFAIQFPNSKKSIERCIKILNNEFNELVSKIEPKDEAANENKDA